MMPPDIDATTPNICATNTPLSGLGTFRHTQVKDTINDPAELAP
jgi:hypothetical protein